MLPKRIPVAPLEMRPVKCGAVTYYIIFDSADPPRMIAQGGRELCDWVMSWWEQNLPIVTKGPVVDSQQVG